MAVKQSLNYAAFTARDSSKAQDCAGAGGVLSLRGGGSGIGALASSQERHRVAASPEYYPNHGLL